MDAMLGMDPDGAPTRAAALEADGFDAAWCGETAHDPFLTLGFAATATQRIRLGTGVAIAFARSPMTLAMLANDLQLSTEGRFLLGLGSQVRAHIERRYGVSWSRPVGRMRELILAVRHIWSCWHDGTRPDFAGEFTTHTLMPPAFSPGVNPYGTPPIFLAAVGPRMTEVAGEVADGLIVHSFVTERYLREVTVPAVMRGATAAGRGREDLQISYPAFVATGNGEAALAGAIEGVREQIAFYGSTPAYRSVLELHGWGGLHEELHALSKRGAWDAMTRLVDDTVLSEFAAVGEPHAAASCLRERFGDLIDRVTLYAPYEIDGECLRELAGLLRREAHRNGAPLVEVEGSA